jgi:excisionase family DNA binding protein
VSLLPQPMTLPIRLLLDSHHAAQALQVSPRTLWQLAKDGKIRAVKIGRSVRFSVAELERFIGEAQRQNGGAA